MSNSNKDGKILSICVSKPKTVLFDGQYVNTGIFKEPIDGEVALRKFNLDGDEQADLSVHGGPDKAVYSYASEHYPWWQQKLPEFDFPYGKFGENFTTAGLLENVVCIGDEFQVGTAVIKVAQPRLPCYKLGIKFGRNDVIKTFFHSGFSGIYFSVVEEGVVRTGDAIIFLRSDGCNITVEDCANFFNGKRARDPEFVERCLNSQLAEQTKMFIRSSMAKQSRHAD